MVNASGVATNIIEKDSEDYAQHLRKYIMRAFFFRKLCATYIHAIYPIINFLSHDVEE